MGLINRRTLTGLEKKREEESQSKTLNSFSRSGWRRDGEPCVVVWRT